MGVLLTKETQKTDVCLLLCSVLSSWLNEKEISLLKDSYHNSNNLLNRDPYVKRKLCLSKNVGNVYEGNI